MPRRYRRTKRGSLSLETVKSAIYPRAGYRSTWRRSARPPSHLSTASSELTSGCSRFRTSRRRSSTRYVTISWKVSFYGGARALRGTSTNRIYLTWRDAKDSPVYENAPLHRLRRRQRPDFLVQPVGRRQRDLVKRVRCPGRCRSTGSTGPSCGTGRPGTVTGP